MRNIEQELKLVLTEREYNMLTGGRQAEVQINNYFYGKGLKPDIMVRVREKKDAYILCVKQKVSDVRGVTLSEERECEITEGLAEAFIRNGITSEKLLTLLGADVDTDLYCVGKLTTHRTSYTLEEWNIEIDKNEYLGVTDYELECENRRIEQLDKLKNYLFLTYGIKAVPSAAKSLRFFGRLGEMAETPL